jgi:ribosomal protein S18 acetylase RimI-like enzyme
MKVARRTMTPEDEPFVRNLIITTVADELAAWAWPEALRAQLLEMQYKGRRQAIDDGYTDAERQIILLDEQPVGWVVVLTGEQDTHIIDIAIMPDQRGKGIGGTVLGEIIAASDCRGKSTRLSVNITNRAAHLYERLGFRRIGGDEVQHFLEKSPV